MMNANPRCGTLRNPLIMCTILFTYVARSIAEKCFDNWGILKMATVKFV